MFLKSYRGKHDIKYSIYLGYYLYICLVLNKIGMNTVTLLLFGLIYFFFTCFIFIFIFFPFFIFFYLFLLYIIFFLTYLLFFNIIYFFDGKIKIFYLCCRNKIFNEFLFRFYQLFNIL